MGRTKVTVRKSAPASASVSVAKSKSKSADEKKEGRRTRQAKAGIAFSVNKLHRLLSTKRGGGKVSTDAAVAVAALSDYITRYIFTHASEVADRGIAPGEDQTHRKITSACVQTVLTESPWIRQFLAKGRVAGTAPVANHAPLEVPGSEDNESN